MGGRGGGGGGWWAERDERSKRATKNFSAGAISDPHPFYFSVSFFFALGQGNQSGGLPTSASVGGCCSRWALVTCTRRSYNLILYKGRKAEKSSWSTRKRKRAKRKSGGWDGVQVDRRPCEGFYFPPFCFFSAAALAASSLTSWISSSSSSRISIIPLSSPIAWRSSRGLMSRSK